MSMRQDKRRHPRVAKRIRVRSTSREAVELETIDLSAGGFSCTAPAFLPLMTKLAVSLVLPGHDAQQAASEQVVSGEAVVVRSDPAPAHDGGGYRVALFFSRISDDDRRRLVQFLKGNGGNGAR